MRIACTSMTDSQAHKLPSVPPLSLSLSFDLSLSFSVILSLSLCFSHSLFYLSCLYFAMFVAFVHLNLRRRKGQQLSLKYVSFVNMQTFTLVSNSLPLPSHTRVWIILFWIGLLDWIHFYESYFQQADFAYKHFPSVGPFYIWDVYNIKCLHKKNVNILKRLYR